MVAYQVIGKSLPPEGADEKVTGAALYSADIALPGTLFGKCLSSPYPHATIVRIDASAARRVKGVHAVLTGQDLRDAGLWGRAVKDVPVLAVDRVRYAGERVAAVAADDEDLARQAIDLIEVEYEELPAVFEPDEARLPGAPILHPGFNAYPGFRQKQDKPSNVYHHTVFDKGDLEQGFADADIVVDETYVTQRVHQGYLEPQAVLVDVQDGRVHVWVCSKSPYVTREALAFSAQIDEKDILFHPVSIGGDFGGKGAARNTPICYYLAKATGRPVRMVSDYLEEFLVGSPRHATATRLRTGVKLDGSIVAHHVDYVVNCGAYAAFKPGGTIGGANQAAGPYRIPNCRIESTHVYTNTVPGGFMRGPGEPQGVFAIESQMDTIARRLGIDPVELRMRNLVDSGDEMPAGEKLDHVRARETLLAAAEASGYGLAKPARAGRGVAVGDRPPGGGIGTSEITLRPDGSCTVGTPIFDQGTGTYTTLRQIAAEEFEVPPELVTIEVWDTDAVDFDSGVAGSRATRVNSIAAHEAVQETRAELLRLAAGELVWPAETLSMQSSAIRRSDTGEAIDWRSLLQRLGRPVKGRARVETTGRSHVTSFVAQVAEVSVDPETGQVTLLGLTTAHDIGQILNPVGHQGQINGAIVQGIGYALTEELKVEDGRVTSLSFGDYKMPTMRDIPPLKTVLLESQDGVGPYAIRGIGESPTAPVAPAIANAIFDAIGVRIQDLPITAEKVYRALKNAPRPTIS